MRLLILLYLCLFSFLNAQDIQVVAHRGGVNWGPENTLATFEIAIAKKVDYIEMDVRQTKDGVFVLMHDKTIDRTTNGMGPINELTWDEVKDLDAGSWFGDSFVGEKIPKLSDVLIAIDGRILPDIDFKAGDPTKLVKLLEEHGYLDGRPLTLYSGNHDLIKQVQSLTDKILVRPSIKTSYKELAESLDPPLVNLSFKKFKAHQDEIEADDKLCFVNCLFLSNRKRAIKKAVKREADFIQTDKLDYLLKLLNH